MSPALNGREMIREIVANDVQGLAELVCDHMSIRDPDVMQRVCHEFKTCLRSDERCVYISLSDQNECLGFAVVHWIPFPLIKGHEGYISDLVVREKFRGQGVGSELMSAVEDKARQRGCSRLMVNNPKGAASYERRFYNKRGFEEREHFANFVKTL